MATAELSDTQLLKDAIAMRLAGIDDRVFFECSFDAGRQIPQTKTSDCGTVGGL
ncbi:MAG: hypothetical protein FWH27_00025 [Planctomycetaceae bacterium]|nr:hypothetical protein [Planctomycetaceae bacterium]